MIPEATLRPMYYMVNPPKLAGYDVLVNGELIATLAPEHVNAIVNMKHYMEFKNETSIPKSKTE